MAGMIRMGSCTKIVRTRRFYQSMQSPCTSRGERSIIDSFLAGTGVLARIQLLPKYLFGIVLLRSFTLYLGSDMFPFENPVACFLEQEAMRYQDCYKMLGSNTSRTTEADPDILSSCIKC
jgi:hypothetical protein